MEDRWSLGNSLLMDVSNRPRRLVAAGRDRCEWFHAVLEFNLLTDYDATAYSLYAADEWQVTERCVSISASATTTQSIDGSRSSNAADVARSRRQSGDALRQRGVS